MKWSKSFIPTLKEDPQEAEAVSHKLMVRAGLVRRLTAGAYTYLPMGYKALEKAKKIVQQEMNSAGAAELFMPALQPPELWKRTGRYDDMGEVMIKFTDRHGKEITLGPTHEEVVTDLVAKEVRSYKDLPLILYQIQTKFRDEVRPRFGVVRSCEFIMKDAYSFDTSIENMEKSYKAMYDAYCRIFERCGIPYIPVEADPGLMGGTVSHEFMVPSEIGEDRIIVCSSCGYAASTEVAAVNSKAEKPKVSKNEIKEVATPELTSVEEVSKFLKVKTDKIIKTLIYIADEEPVAVLFRGDHEANEAKIKKYLNAHTLELASEGKIKEVTGAAVGFSGPVGLKIRIVADFSVSEITDGVTGANKKDTHLTGVNHGRDFNVKEWIDARVITEKDTCPKCGKKIELKTAIEIGHTFKLGTKYSVPLRAVFLDSDGKEKSVIMGCYGIGVNRILASVIETSHDENGIIWPVSLAPAEVVIVAIKMEDEEVKHEAEKTYNDLKEKGIDVILDDRDKTAGVKFKDADLVGFPFQVIVGKKGLSEGKLEVKERSTGTKQMIEKDGVVDFLIKNLSE